MLKETYKGNVDIGDFVGEVFTDIEVKGEDAIIFTHSSGRKFQMFHSYDCCENVVIEDITGEVHKLCDTPILAAYKSTNRTDPPSSINGNHGEYTWTFYRIATIETTVVIRWYGTSNGYYSEEVSLQEIK